MVVLSVMVLKNNVKILPTKLLANGVVFRVTLNVLNATWLMMNGVQFVLPTTSDISVLGVLKSVLVVLMVVALLVINSNKLVISISMTTKILLIMISFLKVMNLNMKTNSTTLTLRLTVVYLLIQLASVVEILFVT